jgi:molybdopterin/thiamine biosynthesis adenylyltransferase
MNQHRDALARTTLLVNRELFSGDADQGAIADALLSTTVRLEADHATLVSRAGQSAFITGFVLTARLGIGIEVVAPNVPVIDLGAPLQKPRLVDALVDLGSDLIPGARVRTKPGPVEERFVLGAPSGAALPDVRVVVGDFTADLARGEEIEGSQGDLPLGGFAAGAAIAAIALEAALPRIEEATGLSARRLRPSPGPPVRIDLRDVFPELEAGPALELGKVDAISGGAITHALIFCLLRIPGLQVDLRVVEAQIAELSNVNRYMLLRASDDGRVKIEELEAAATSAIRIAGVPALFTKNTRETIVPLAERVVVGVDDVEARWWVQAENPAWLAVGATGNHLAQLTTHTPDSPCAACAHPTPLPPQTIPTISFVSFWAGLLQACALVSKIPPVARNVVVYPFALGGQTPTLTFTLVANPVCPNGCVASRAARGVAA